MTRFQNALAFLNQHINLERKRADQFKPSAMDPDRPARLLAQLGDPHHTYPSLHIAGTKGKGSTAALCAARLAAAGYKVGLHTSPHLQDVRERFRIWHGDDRDGLISRDAFAGVVDQLRPAAAQLPGVTWFELTTALAFLYFAQQGVDAAVVEVGLGGRLDATNVLLPLVSLITHISFDHTALLGNTLAAIAGEKGGIIKPGVPVVVARQAPAAAERLRAIAAESEAPLLQIGADWQYSGEVRRKGATPYQRITITRAPAGALTPAGGAFDLGLLGAHQQENAVTALAALSLVRGRFPALVGAPDSGWADLRWSGRLQILQDSPEAPTLIADGAHNPHSAAALRAALSATFDYDHLFLVIGCHVDKDVAGLLSALLPGAAHAFLTAANSPRALPVDQLLAAAAGHDTLVSGQATVPQAVAAAREMAAAGDLICVTGSLYIVGELLNWWDSLKSTG